MTCCRQEGGRILRALKRRLHLHLGSGRTSSLNGRDTGGQQRQRDHFGAVHQRAVKLAQARGRLRAHAPQPNAAVTAARDQPRAHGVAMRAASRAGGARVGRFERLIRNGQHLHVWRAFVHARGHQRQMCASRQSATLVNEVTCRQVTALLPPRRNSVSK